MKIYAPNKTSCGVWATVRFVDGVGETDDLHLIEWFKQNGYRVEESVHQNKVVGTKPYTADRIDYTSQDLEFDKMTPNQIREWLKLHGMGKEMKNIRNKEKLLEMVKQVKG